MPDPGRDPESREHRRWRNKLSTKESTTRALLTFFFYAELQKKERESTFNDLKDERTDPPSPAAAAHGGDKEPRCPEGGPAPGHSVVHSAESGPDCSPGTRSQTRRYLRCPHGLGMSTSGTGASQIVLQALCDQVNPRPLTMPLINPEFKNSPAGFPASPSSPPTAPQGKRKEEKLVKQN